MSVSAESSRTPCVVHGALPDLSFIDLLPLPAYAIDGSARIVRWNRLASETWGREPTPNDRYCGSLRIVSIDGCPVAHADAPMAWCLREGRTVRDAEAVCVRPDGSRVRAIVNCTPLRDAAGRVVGALNVFVDIDRKQRVHDRLAEAEARLELAMEAAELGAFEFDLATRTTVASASLDRIAGLEPSSAPRPAEEWNARVHPEDLADVRAALARAIADGGRYRNEHRLVRPDGAVRWVATSARVVPGGDGAPARVVGVTADVTERRRLTDLAATVDRRYRDLAEGAPHLVWMHDVDGRMLALNRRWREYTGLDGEADASWRQAVHPDDLAPLMALCAVKRAAGEPHEGSFRVRSRDGSWRWFRGHAWPRRDETGAIAYWHGIAVDVHDQRCLTDSLRATEERLAAALAAARIGTWRWDATSDAIEWDASLRAVVGVAEDEAIPYGSRFAEWIHAEDRDRVAAAIAAALAGTAEYDVEFRLHHRDGSWHWHRSRGRVLRGPDAAPTGMIGACIDVTELREAEIAVADAARQLRLVIDLVPAFVSYVDRDTRYRFVNAAYEPAFGRERPAIVGSTVREVVGEAVWSRIAPRLSAALAGASVQFEHEITASDGSRRHLRGAYVPDAAPDGRTRGVVALVADITDAKRAEQRLAATAAELERSNDELERFAYIASHDLQEPLRMVTTYLSLLERRLGSGLDDRCRGYVGIAVANAARMRELIDAVLAYARVDRSADPPQAVALREVVDEVLAALRELVHEAGARVSVGELPTLLGDRAGLSLVLQNLVGNALKFRGDAPPEIAISASFEGSSWRIAVADNGIGIDPAHHARLFRVFGRLHPVAKYAGSGIGLATCKRIVERIGGRIWVDSSPGRGAAFSFTVPSGVPGVAASTEQPSTCLAVVDDNADDVGLLRETLDPNEFRVLGFAGGRALAAGLADLATSQLPRIVLVDLNMPDMDGRAVLSFLRSHERYRGMRVVMYTSSTRQAERQECLELGADDYVIKPASVSDCAGVVERLRRLR